MFLMPPFNIEVHEYFGRYLSGAPATRVVARCTVVTVLSSPGHQFIPPRAFPVPDDEDAECCHLVRWRVLPPYDCYVVSRCCPPAVH